VRWHAWGMRHTPHFLMTDPAEVRRLIRAHPWATIVSSTTQGLVASHYPVIIDESASTGDDIVLLSHFGRPDDELHELGEHEILIIVQGPHDYVSPSWYGNGEVIPTWDHVTAHLYGTPEILSPEENFAALSLLTDHFEHGRPGGHVARRRRGALSSRRAGDRRPAPARDAIRGAREAQPEQAPRGPRAHRRAIRRVQSAARRGDPPRHSVTEPSFRAIRSRSIPRTPGHSAAVMENIAVSRS